MSNKKAQVAETITWIVATLIIFVTLSLALLATSYISTRDKALDYTQILGNSALQGSNAFLLKESLISFALTKNSEGKTIYNEIDEKKQLSSFDTELASKIFTDSILQVSQGSNYFGAAVLESISLGNGYKLKLIKKDGKANI